MLRSAIARTTRRCYTYRYTVLKNWHPATFHAKNVSIMSAPSIKESVAIVLKYRGFSWESFDIKKVEFDSNSISFAEEWGKFAFLVTKIATGSSVTREQLPTAEDVWKKHFENVITNAPNFHASEASFKDGLFDALRNSLYNFAYPIVIDGSDRNLIVLQSRHGIRVGFGKDVQREKLGFKEENGLSKNSRYDHGCFVFGTMKRPSSGRDETNHNIYDLTAVVELKLEKTSCKCLDVAEEDSKEIAPPSFDNGHHSLGQAMVYSMDVWHCLARRGVSVKSIPVVVLAGKSETKDLDRLCCLEANINIPMRCGDKFVYSVNRIVSFNGQNGIVTDEVLSEDAAALLRNSRDRRAMAIYIRTMRIGLEHAIEVIKNSYERNLMSSPVSLCCQQLLKTSRAQLIASPIPYANAFQDSGLRVQQGELFKLTNPTKKDFSGFMGLCWFVDSETNDDILAQNCLVKVSCLSIHNTHISHLDCKDALNNLYNECKKNRQLKQGLSKVLFGYCYIKSSDFQISTLVSIMRNLQAGEDNFQTLEHRKLQKQGRLPHLWSAFCDLVKSLLLPMASANVIHLDIRSNEEITYNILVDENPKGRGDACAMELCLIDYDSVVVSGDISGPLQDSSVPLKALKKSSLKGKGGILDSAYRYLFWQVLWIAYTWYPPSTTSVSPGTQLKKIKSLNFVYFLFADNHYEDFKKWLGNDMKALADEPINAATIEKTLEVLKCVFCKSGSL